MLSAFVALRYPFAILRLYLHRLYGVHRPVHREWSAGRGRVSGGKSIAFNPDEDIPPLDGKVILVTGGNTGLGKQAVLEYARHGPAQIWLAARSLDKAQDVVNEIRWEIPDAPPIKVLELDLSSLESVKKAASVFSAAARRLDILMFNAGIMGTLPGLTKDGYELQFGVNYVGHALLAKLLLPMLEGTAALPDADVRIVTLSSHGHLTYAPKEGIRFHALMTNGDTLGAYERYGQSKLAMTLWTRQMAQLYPQFTLASVHPGTVRTNIMRGATGAPWIFQMLGKVAEKMITPVGQGVKNQLWASVAKGVKSGEYYEPVGVAGLASANAEDDDLAKELWDWTETELKDHVA